MDKDANKKKYCWLVRNSANIVTLSRFLIPIVLFLSLWEIEQKMLVCLILASTDLFDGWLARKFGNPDGIGKRLDPIADKITLLSGLLYLFREGFIGEMLFYALFVSETLTSIITGVKARMIWSENHNSGEMGVTMSIENLLLFLKSKGEKIKEVNKRLDVTRFGRCKMGCYFSGVVSIYISYVFTADIFQHFSVILLWSGFFVSGIVIITYLFEIDWQEKFFG
ncbi:CDP-alcohol phosphatidyltransferase family protein [bacterium]|nr:CDP-alcohol phosphatidyltransferase family protein [bacterium]